MCVSSVSGLSVMANINLEALKKKIIGKQNANPSFYVVCISVPTSLADCFLQHCSAGHSVQGVSLLCPG